jgi:predicted membrane chloride channel (bestrophin family)
LPLALWGSCGFFMVPTVMIISFVLLGIEEIGVQIEVGAVTGVVVGVWWRWD